MIQKRAGKQTFCFSNPVSILGNASVVGKKEGEGPLKDCFDKVLYDSLMGEKSWEKAESRMFEQAVNIAIQKAGITQENLAFILGGDLLDQIISTSFAARQMGIPCIGLYSACATITEALLLGTMMVDGGFADYLACAASSHFCTAERQYRFPLEQGSIRTQTAQWTVTGAGAFVLEKGGKGPYIKMATVGKVIDYGVKLADHMGAAMAPAAADTLLSHFRDAGRTPLDYDLIVTGDLGRIGKQLLHELLLEGGYSVSDRHIDCGCEIFDFEKQDVHAGGSGAGCASVVLAGSILPKIKRGVYKRVLLAATGALLSPTSIAQGETIPAISHAIVIERE